MRESSRRIGNAFVRNIVNDYSGFFVSERIENFEPLESGRVTPVRSLEESVQRGMGLPIGFSAIQGGRGPARECFDGTVVILGSEPFCSFLVEQISSET